MPINQINQTGAGAASKKDPLDKILQGLQIANEVFKIPVQYQDLRAKGAEADIKTAEASGAPTTTQYLKSGYVPVNAADAKALGVESKVTPDGGILPDQSPLMPGQFGPEAPNVSYGPNISLLPATEDGKKTLLPMVNSEEKKTHDTRRAKLQDDYTKDFEDLQNVGLNYQNALAAYGKAIKGDKAAAYALVQNAAKLENPGLNRAPDGSGLTAGGSYSEGLQKFVNKVTGSGSSELLPNEVKEVMGIANDAMTSRVQQAYAVNTKYTDRANTDRIDPKELGLSDLAPLQAAHDKGVKGLESGGTPTKSIGGKTFKKVKGGWQEVD